MDANGVGTHVDDLPEVLAEIDDESRPKRLPRHPSAGAAGDQRKLILGRIARPKPCTSSSSRGTATPSGCTWKMLASVLYKRPCQHIKVQVALEETLQIVGNAAALLFVHGVVNPHRVAMEIIR